LREVDPDLSPEIEKIVAKLMRKKPGERYQTPKELIAALEEYERARREGTSRSTGPSVKRTTRRRRR
jgi:hypothetical protein